MKCKVLSCLLCVLFCFSTFSLSCLGADTEADFIERGYQKDENGNFYHYGFDPELYNSVSLLTVDEPNISFDPKQLPWSDTPSYVQELIYSGIDKYKIGDASSFRVPFVLIRVTSSTATVYVGYNLFIGFNTSTASRAIRICVRDLFYDNHALYSASYNTKTYAMKSDWQKLESVEWGNQGNIRYFGSTLCLRDQAYDFYVYGGNIADYRDYTSGQIALSVSSSDVTTWVAYLMNLNTGFTAGRYFPYQDEYTAMYIGNFIPPTVEQQQSTTQKGILASIKAIPDNIKGFFTSLGDRISGFFDNLFEKIKGLFLPSDGFFQSYIDSYQNYFSDSLGILYELPEAVIDILWTFIEFEPQENGYGIPIPEVSLPIKHEDGNYRNFTIFEEQYYEFDFLNDGAFATLYEFYRLFVWVIILLCLVSFALKKFNQITGG